jgi:hypothetical protein
MIKSGQATNWIFFNDNKDLELFLDKSQKQNIYINQGIGSTTKC